MIYATYERALKAATLLNLRRGHPRARPVFWAPYGWTVIGSYAYGLSG